MGDYVAHSPSASSVPSLSHGGSSKCSPHTGSVKDNLQCLLDLYSPALGTKTSSGSEALVGIFADVNLRQLAVKYDPPELGVNPADIMGEDTCVKSETETDGSPHLCYPSFSPPERDMQIEDAKPDDAAFPDDAINVIVSVLSASKREQDLQEARLSAQSASCTPWPTIPSSGNASAAPAIFSHLAAPMVTQPWSFPSPARMAPPDRFPLAPIFSPQATPFIPLSQAADRVIKPQSPILNAHMGVDLQLLRRRADDFRRTNPGIDIDKTWLQEYAGRLSERGELIEDYRCYVVGCTQRNKRKDHILVHIGSHVEHRPFQCNHCGMRFLRKNECKRHESSHGGRKPFQCSICAPMQDKSFVRQDLLKRHMRVAHGVQTESAADRRKRAKLAEDGEFWP
ncbi:hypothetical protein IEO21_02869 [Rhodonia placenta]|uniref:C2H2-type domain-containing protein n=1 Tax=Rhodonia placenta TaxID=104341 RepID=A0A8H7P7E2_9APHY|nr:hypothetical protein IEO21_02869 [Postia placenta]